MQSLREIASGTLHVACALAALSLPPRSASQAAPPTAFVDVTVVPLDHDGELAHQTVLVRGGKIVSMRPAAQATVPPDAVRIDGRGRWLMPGLVDMHVHLFSRTDLDLYLANGVTTVRNLGGYGFADSLLAARAAIARGELLGPTIFTSGNWLDGDPPVRPINTVLRTPAEARAEVDREADAGYDFIKVYANLAPAAYAAIIAEAKARRIPVTGHVPRAVGLVGVLASGQVELAHAGAVFFAAGRDPARFAGEARRVADAGVAVATTLSMAHLAFRLSGRPDVIATVTSSPAMRYIPPERVAFWRDQNQFAHFTPQPDPAQLSARLDALAGALHAAGVTLLAGTDADVAGQLPGFSMPDELNDLVAGGLTPYQALRAASADPYQYLARVLPRHVEPFGTVQPGRRADLLLLEGDPLADVASVRRIAGVMVRGHWLTAADLENRLAEVARRYAKDQPAR